MSTKHTQEPWVQDENRFGTPVITGYNSDGRGDELTCVLSERNKQNEANAERIVACVNACAGFHDPEMVIRFMKHLWLSPDSGRIEAKEVFVELESLKDENEQLKKQQDLMVNVLKDIINVPSGGYMGSLILQVKSALKLVGYGKDL